MARPLLELKGFQRVLLKKGGKRTVHFDITPDMLQMLDKENKTVTEPGIFRIIVKGNVFENNAWFVGIKTKNES